MRSQRQKLLNALWDRQPRDRGRGQGGERGQGVAGVRGKALGALTWEAGLAGRWGPPRQGRTVTQQRHEQLLSAY